MATWEEKNNDAKRAWREDVGEWHVLLHDDIPSGKHRLSFHRKRRVHTDKFGAWACAK